MTYVNIHDAKTHFSSLIKAVLNGEDVVIARSGKPVVRLSIYEGVHTPRHGGQLKGILKFDENFDAPLPDDVLNEFYKEDD